MRSWKGTRRCTSGYRSKANYLPVKSKIFPRCDEDSIISCAWRACSMRESRVDDRLHRALFDERPDFFAKSVRDLGFLRDRARP